MDNTSLGDRMKNYERVTQSALIKRMPVIIRLDGKAFHTYTKGFDRPYSEDLHNIRLSVLGDLCNEIQGCVFGYSQSDEFSLVLKDWQSYQTDAWFDNNLQKIVSVSASLCTGFWNKYTMSRLEKVAFFDSRAFNLAKEEVLNYLIWRQQDCERNSIQMLAQSLYSHKQLHGINCSDLVAKVEQDHGIVWGNLPAWKKRGELYLSGNVTDAPIFKQARNDLEAVLFETQSNAQKES